MGKPLATGSRQRLASLRSARQFALWWFDHFSPTRCGNCLVVPAYEFTKSLT
jgi:hypothetical protein